MSALKQHFEMRASITLSDSKDADFLKAQTEEKVRELLEKEFEVFEKMIDVKNLEEIDKTTTYNITRLYHELIFTIENYIKDDFPNTYKTHCRKWIQNHIAFEIKWKKIELKNGFLRNPYLLEIIKEKFKLFGKEFPSSQQTSPLLLELEKQREISFLEEQIALFNHLGNCIRKYTDANLASLQDLKKK